MHIGICGAGTMGRGIALVSIQSGFSCTLFDIDSALVVSAQDFIRQQLDNAVAKSRLTEEQREKAQQLIRYTSELSELSSSELVIEAIVENSDIKSTLFQRLEEVIEPQTILATNTSSISVASLAKRLQHPERFLGLHFFNPAHLMKLVEIIRAPQTSDVVFQSAQRFVKSIGKSPAIARDVPGFIVNRIARNYYNEAQRIVTESMAEIQQVDAIMRAAGFKMGPFELMDLIGVDVNLDVTKSMYQQYFFEPRFQPSVMQQQYVDAGLHGRKTGRGFYDYSKKS